MFCPSCGTKIMDGSKFCSNCGFSLAAGFAAAAPPAKTRQIKVVRRVAMSDRAFLWEVNLLDDTGYCVSATTLPSGGSVFIDCECGVRYHLNAAVVGSVNKCKSKDIIIEPGDENITIELKVKGFGIGVVN